MGYLLAEYERHGNMAAALEVYNSISLDTKYAMQETPWTSTRKA
jgi:hypothetical protein